MFSINNKLNKKFNFNSWIKNERMIKDVNHTKDFKT